MVMLSLDRADVVGDDDRRKYRFEYELAIFILQELLKIKDSDIQAVSDETAYIWFVNNNIKIPTAGFDKALSIYKNDIRVSLIFKYERIVNKIISIFEEKSKVSEDNRVYEFWIHKSNYKIFNYLLKKKYPSGELKDKDVELTIDSLYLPAYSQVLYNPNDIRDQYEIYGDKISDGEYYNLNFDDMERICSILKSGINYRLKIKLLLFIMYQYFSIGMRTPWGDNDSNLNLCLQHLRDDFKYSDLGKEVNSFKDISTVSALLINTKYEKNIKYRYYLLRDPEIWENNSDVPYSVGRDLVVALSKFFNK